MPYSFNPLDKKFKNAPSYWLLLKPLREILSRITSLEARGNRPLQMEFEDQLNALIYFHLEEHTSGRHLLQVLKEDKFAREAVAPNAGIEKSSFFEAINSRGLDQLMEVFQALQANATGILPAEFSNLGEFRGHHTEFLTMYSCSIFSCRQKVIPDGAFLVRPAGRIHLEV